MSQFESKYTYEQKLEICNAYVVQFGSIKKVASMYNIPRTTISSWTKTPWWADMVLQVRQAHQNRLSGKMAAMADLALKEMKDRLKEGDEVLWAQTGEMLKKKVSLRDATDALSKVMVQKQLIEGLPTAHVKKTTVTDQLKELQDGLENIVFEEDTKEEEKPTAH